MQAARQPPYVPVSRSQPLTNHVRSPLAVTPPSLPSTVDGQLFTTPKAEHIVLIQCVASCALGNSLVPPLVVEEIALSTALSCLQCSRVGMVRHDTVREHVGSISWESA